MKFAKGNTHYVSMLSKGAIIPGLCLSFPLGEERMSRIFAVSFPKNF